MEDACYKSRIGVPNTDEVDSDDAGKEFVSSVFTTTNCICNIILIDLCIQILRFCKYIVDKKV